MRCRSILKQKVSTSIAVRAFYQQGFFLFVNRRAVVITPKTATEFKFVSELLKKLGISSATMSKSELEDIGISKLLKSVDKSKKVSRDNIMNKLSSK